MHKNSIWFNGAKDNQRLNFYTDIGVQNLGTNNRRTVPEIQGPPGLKFRLWENISASFSYFFLFAPLASL